MEKKRNAFTWLPKPAQLFLILTERIVATVFCFFLTITRKTTTTYGGRDSSTLFDIRKHIQIAKLEANLENMLFHLTM